MAKYRVGQSTYEIPDDLTPAQLEQTLIELSYNEGIAKRQGAFSYGLDQAGLMAGKGTEALGRFIGVKDLEDVGTGYAWLKERDIQQGGYIPTYDKPLSEYVGTGDFFGALWEKSLENAPSGGVALVGTGAAAVAAVYSAPAALAIGGVTTAGSALMGTGEAALEQEQKTGDYNPGTAVGIGALIGLLDRYGAGKVIPKSSLMKMSVGELTQELAEKGYGDAALAVSKRAVKNFAAEGTTEMGQEALSMGGAVLQGGEYTADEVGSRMFEAGVLGGTLGSTTSVGIDATKGVVNAAGNIVPSSAIVGEDQAAAADFARDLQNQIVNNDLDINDLDKQSTKGVRQAVDNLHIRYDEDMKQLIKDLRERLQIKDGDPRDLVLKKILAKVAYREARNKTKSTVGAEEMQAVMELTGDTSEGQQLVSIMRRMNELTNLHNSGYQGGVSRITDSFSPLGSTIGYDKGQASFERLARPIASLGAATINPMIPVGQAAAVGAGRLIDRVTGRRNKVQRYIKGNINNPGVQSPDVPSVREQARQRDLTAQMQQEQEQRDREAMNTNLFLSGAKPTPGSPQDVMEQSTGLDRDGVVRLLTIISRSSGNPALKRAADSAAESVFRGGRVPDLSPLIREMNKRLDNVPDLGVTRVREPIRDYNPEGAQAQPMGTRDPRGANYERGIRDNQAAVDELIAAADADDTLSPSDKSVVKTALMAMRKNLGADPASRVRSIYNEAAANLSDPAIAETYMLPYVQRVEAQANVSPEQQQDSDNILDQFPEINQMAVPNIGEGLSVFPKTRKLYKKIDGVDVDQGNYVADGNDVTGVTFDGARIAIDPQTGRGKLEVDPKPVKTPSKKTGKRWHSNLVRPNLWDWVENSSGLPMSFITTVEQGSQHFYAMNVEADVPTEMYRKPKGDEPTMRPRGFGRVVPGNQIGTIVLKSSGKQHPIYDTVRIEPEGEISLSQEVRLDQPIENDPMRVSTRVPEGNNALADPLAEDLQVSVEAIKSAPGNKNGTVFERMLGKLNAYVGMKGFARDNNTIPSDRQFIELVKRNLLFLYNSVTPEYRERARKWYAGANRLSKAVGERFGLTTPQVAGVMAVLSPQQDWYMNYDIGVRVIDTYLNQQDAVFGEAEQAEFQKMIDATEAFTIKQGKDPATAPSLVGYKASLNNMRGKRLKDMPVKEQAIFVRFWDAANNPNGGSHQVISPEGELVGTRMNEDGVTPSSIRFNGFGMVEKAINIINNGSRETIHTNLGTRHKVRSFYNNILNPFSDKGDVTIDTHAVAAGLLRPLAGSDIEVSYNLGTAGEGSKISGTMGSYGVYADAYREAAAEVGVLPREMQSITWEAIRGLFTSGFKTAGNKAKVKEIWQRYDNGDITLEQVYGEINDLAGGINKAAWEGSSPRLDTEIPGQPGSTNQPGVLPGNDGRGVLNDPSGSDGRGVTSGTAGVLQQAAESEGTVQSQEPTFDRADNGQPQGDTQRSEPSTSVAGSRPANPAELREADKVVKAIFEVGKPGSPFENGIKDIRTVKSIVEAFHHMFIIAKNSAQLKKAFKGSLGSKGFTRGGFEAPLKRPGGSGTVAVLSGDYVNPNNPNKTGGGKNQELWTALHELGHVIEANYRFGNNRQNEEGVLSSQSYYSPVKGTNVKGGNVYEDTFRQIMVSVLGTQSITSKANAKKREVSKAIYDEIVGLQRKGLIPGTDLRVRDSYRIFEEMSPERQAVNKQKLKDIEASYLQSPEELAADAIAYYLADPQLAKQNMPTTAKLIREAFTKNRTIQFFNLPLGVILAGIIANMAVAMKEDEDEKAALSLGSAALSA